MSKKTLLVLGLGIGLGMAWAGGGGAVARAAESLSMERAPGAPDAAIVQELQTALLELEGALRQVETALLARTAEELADPKWKSIQATLGGLRSTLGGIRTALLEPAGQFIANAEAPAPPVMADYLAPTLPAETNGSQAAAASVGGLVRSLSAGKILLALLILVGGGGLIAYALHDSEPRPAVIVKTVPNSSTQP